MKNFAANRQGIRQDFSFKTHGQRDAGPELRYLSLPTNIIQANDFCLLPLRLVATGN